MHPVKFSFTKRGENEGGNETLFQGFSYEERFDIGEVPPTQVRKKKIDNCVILSEINLGEKRKVFGENKVFMHFLHV